MVPFNLLHKGPECDSKEWTAHADSDFNFSYNFGFQKLKKQSNSDKTFFF